MKIHDIFTPESVEAYQSHYQMAATPGLELFEEYVRDREEQLRDSPDLARWISILEEGDLTSAADPTLWSSLIRDGFIACEPKKFNHSTQESFLFRLISPKVFDAFRDRANLHSDYAFTEVRVCTRINQVVSSTINIPDRWDNPALIDTELFELPPDVAPDNMDDREKIHLIYLAAIHKGRFVFKPVYIGIGTGEAYGVGTRSRPTHGRFRFYRYDIIDNFHLEYILRSDALEFTINDATQVPDVTSIGDDLATILLGRSSSDSGFMCLSDPNIAKYHALWLRENPRNQMVYQKVLLKKIHDDIRTNTTSTPFQADDVKTVLEYTWQTHRLYFATWQHPQRLSEKEGLDLYFNELPAFRRESYDIFRIRPELFSMKHRDQGDTFTIPQVLWSENLRADLEKTVPGAAQRLEKWIWQEAIEDLYAYGNHPELRLCLAISLWRRLFDSGLWEGMLKATYHKELHSFSISPEAMVS